MAIFQMNPANHYKMSAFLNFIGVRMMDVVVTTGDIRCAKLQSNCHHQ